jgi:hypothetical protein
MEGGGCDLVWHLSYCLHAIFFAGRNTFAMDATDTHHAFNNACCRFNDLGCCPPIDPVVQTVALRRLKEVGQHHNRKQQGVEL